MRNTRSDWVPPLAVFVALATLAWVGWWRDLQSARKYAKETSYMVAASTAYQIAESISEDKNSLEPIRSRYVGGAMPEKSEFEERAGILQNQRPEITAVALVEPSGKIKWAHSDASS